VSDSAALTTTNSDGSVTQRVLGFWPLTALVTGNMIGSGIFLLPAALAAIGSIGIVGWIFTATGAIFLSIIFARLGYLLPKTGGAYTFCREGFGDFIGFQIAFSYWVQSWVGNAAIVLAFVGYLSVFWPELTANPWVTFGVATATVWLLTGVNLLGIREAGWVQLVTTILKLTPLLAIILFGIWYIQAGHFAQFNISGKSNFAAITDAATLTLWSFIGLEAATIPAGAVKNPQRDIPRATVIGTLIAAFVYILSTIAVFGLVPMETLAQSHAPYADAGKIVFGPWASSFIAIGAAISCFGCLNGWILVQAHVPLAAARDGLFPRMFTKLNRAGVPIWGLLVSSSLVTILLSLNLHKSLVKQFTFAILLATLASLIPYLYTMMSYFLINRRHPTTIPTSKSTIFLNIVAILGFCYAFWAMSGAGMDTVFYGIMLLFGSLPLYSYIQWRNRKKVTIQPAND
jgi:APA family basic amino acid/polyamine antiporter